MVSECFAAALGYYEPAAGDDYPTYRAATIHLVRRLLVGGMAPVEVARLLDTMNQRSEHWRANGRYPDPAPEPKEDD
jgi:hypothetical protein